MSNILKQIKDQIRIARARAKKVAEADHKGNKRFYAKSNGMTINTGTEGPCQPDAVPWGGTLKEIKGVIKEVVAGYPAVDSIVIEGGYDAYAEARDIFERNPCEIWAARWTVTVWTREGGLCALPPASLLDKP